MERHQSIQFLDDESSILLKADQFLQNIFDQHKDSKLVFHNYSALNQAMDLARQFCVAENASTIEKETAILATGFYFTGFLTDYDHPEQAGKKYLQIFMNGEEMPAERIGGVLKSIDAIAGRSRPNLKADQVAKDAITVVTYVLDYPERHPLMKLEREFLQKLIMDRGAWAQLQMQELLQQKLFTATARQQYENGLSQSILLHKQRIEKEKRNLQRKNGPESSSGNFQGIEDTPLRTMQTFFRSNYRNHINLSAIADNKANIMISVNAILISVLITFLSYRNISTNTPMIMLPVVIFLVTGLASLTFAILSARPKVTSLNARLKDKTQAKKNIVFFGNFVTLKLEDYEEAMDEMFRDGELLLGNMTRDLYFLGKVLDKKYRYLTASYNIFMVGFVATVVTFLVMLFS
ncbi:MAG: hypothetical protein DWQ02_18355 [Bacteroidetes bacterium]|nr:MAG: hypothetical protein DWQ02_18355 [Bacteroidota bacterium]